jgi:hypothetical protein
MRAVIFLGPSLPRSDARQILDAVYLPPARQSDILSAISCYRPDVIGLIDGEFGQSLSIWHKEILYALSHGIAVFGASSMGALRAAETSAYGTIGVGRVYRMFASGELNDDDEVALAHGLDDSGYRALSEPMVNLRCTFRRAAADGVATADECDRLIAIAKALFFRERTFTRIFAEAAREGMAGDIVARLRAFVCAHYVDVKRQDAIELLETIRDLPSPPVPAADFSFNRTQFFEALYNRDRRVTHGGAEVALEAIATYAALHLHDFVELNAHALNRALVGVLADVLGAHASERDVAEETRRFRTSRGLNDDAALDAWVARNDLSADEFQQLMTELADCRLLHRWLITQKLMQRSVRIVLDELRLRGSYEEVASRAAQHEAILDEQHRHFRETSYRHLETRDLVIDHLRATPCRMDTHYQVWAQEAGFHSTQDLRVELLRARLVREYTAALAEDASGAIGDRALAARP